MPEARTEMSRPPSAACHATSPEGCKIRYWGIIGIQKVITGRIIVNSESDAKIQVCRPTVVPEGHAEMTRCCMPHHVTSGLYNKT